MLPSYTYALPNGHEVGTVVALDLGGSTLRVAVVCLGGGEGATYNGEGAGFEQNIEAIKRRNWNVGEDVKKLPSREFFDWIVRRIAEVLASAGARDGLSMSLGVTWSFPVEPTSASSGRVQKMGKGYEQWIGIAGTDLKSHFDAAFRRRGLRLRMTALMNDTEATLLSHAYANPATRISLIWGTGINAAVHLPIEAISQEKLSRRPTEWTRVADAVLVNTEVSMYGSGIFPISEADSILDSNSPQPGFQPLEQLTSGRYLGEICRLVMLSAAKQGELFDGQVPEGMQVAFSFNTASMSILEKGDEHLSFETLKETFSFQRAPSSQDMSIIRDISRAISARAAIYLAITLFSLYRLQRDSISTGRSSALPAISEETPPTVAIAYCGAVAEKHPTARDKCQQVLDMLVRFEVTDCPRRNLVLEAADDSGLLGAAVGAAVNATSRTVSSKL